LSLNIARASRCTSSVVVAEATALTRISSGWLPQMKVESRKARSLGVSLMPRIGIEDGRFPQAAVEPPAPPTEGPALPPIP
jgi:hypothetical protein